MAAAAAAAEAEGAGKPASFLSLEPQLQRAVRKKVRRVSKNRVTEVSGAAGMGEPTRPALFGADAAVVPRRRS